MTAFVQGSDVQANNFSPKNPKNVFCNVWCKGCVVAVVDLLPHGDIK